MERIWIAISYTVKFQRFAFWEWKILATCLRYFCCLIRFTLRFQLPFLSLCTVIRYTYEGLYNKYICSLMISSRVTLKYLCVLYLFLQPGILYRLFSSNTVASKFLTPVPVLTWLIHSYHITANLCSCTQEATHRSALLIIIIHTDKQCL